MCSDHNPPKPHTLIIIAPKSCLCQIQSFTLEMRANMEPLLDFVATPRFSIWLCDIRVLTAVCACSKIHETSNNEHFVDALTKRKHLRNKFCSIFCTTFSNEVSTEVVT